KAPESAPKIASVGSAGNETAPLGTAGTVGTAERTGQPGQRDSQTNGRLIVSPIAARMAAENAIDLKTISGTGPNGRIIKRDIETALAGGTPSAGQTAPSFIPSTQVGAAGYRDEPTSQIRRVIAGRLAESIGPIPTFYL